ncbi:hypothetical protein [Sorangium sp. So ce590]
MAPEAEADLNAKAPKRQDAMNDLNAKDAKRLKFLSTSSRPGS